MYKHILVPTDGSKLSDKGVKETIRMAKAIGADITAVHVVDNTYSVFQNEGFVMPDLPELRNQFAKANLTRAAEILDKVKAAANESGVPCDTVVASGDLPYESIIRQADKSKCDLIMMASHGRSGLKGILLGSETAKVLTHSKIPVLVVR
jgi:nucleotide-binding universal stress UspA family protein